MSEAMACFVLLTAMSTDKIIAGLVRKNYSVCPGTENGEMPKDYRKRPSSVLFLCITPQEAKNLDEMHADVVAMIDETKTKIYGFIHWPNKIAPRWGPTNIIFSDEKGGHKTVPLSPAKQEKNKPKLTCIDGGKDNAKE